MFFKVVKMNDVLKTKILLVGKKEQRLQIFPIKVNSFHKMSLCEKQLLCAVIH